VTLHKFLLINPTAGTLGCLKLIRTVPCGGLIAGQTQTERCRRQSEITRPCFAEHSPPTARGRMDAAPAYSQPAHPAIVNVSDGRSMKSPAGFAFVLLLTALTVPPCGTS